MKYMRESGRRKVILRNGPPFPLKPIHPSLLGRPFQFSTQRSSWFLFTSFRASRARFPSSPSHSSTLSSPLAPCTPPSPLPVGSHSSSLSFSASVPRWGHIPLKTRSCRTEIQIVPALRRYRKGELAMEKISAACVMEWSMELEKALRSKKPGQAVKAIQEIGERLQLLSREPKPTMDVYNLYGLVPGEDRLFANTILLRLADAFRLGDRDTRHCIVRVFFSEYKNRDKQNKGKKHDEILSKERVQNPMELLRRVKIVFDTGDVESRALALVLFGCWAHFAKDSVHIRYLILSRLVSSEMLEVKASLFAAGCFSALAADFAAVALDMLLNIITSPETPLAIRLAGTRVFSKMRCSYSIANRAHQIGSKLLLDSSDEDFSVAILVSLSKLAAKSTLLLSEQVNLLILHLNQDKTLRLQATALRCLHFVLTRGVCPAPVRTHLTELLLKIMDESELSSAMQCEALKILQRMHLHELSTDMWTIVEKAAQSNVASKSLLATRILADMSIRLRLTSDIEANGPCFSSLLSFLSILMDRIISLLKPGLDVCENNAEFVHELHTLLGHFLLLVGESPELGIFLLDKSRLLIEHLVDLHDQNLTARDSGASAGNLVEFGGQKGMNMALKLVNDIEKFSLTLIENLNEVGYVTKIIDKVKLLVESVHHCRLFRPYVHMKFSVLLQSQINLTNVLKQSEESSSVCEYFSYSTPLVQQLVEYEILSLELADKMLRKRDYWDAYKAAIFAANHGSWVTASYIFGQLIDKVQSDSFSCWLKALSKFSKSELKIQLFVMPNFGSCLLNLLQTREFHIQLFEDNLGEIGQELTHSEAFIGVYNCVRSSEETLSSICMWGNSYCFQRWYLASRAKLLKTVVDALEVVGCVLVGQGNVKSRVENPEFLRRISEMSIEFKNLGDEFDLLAMSSIGMDVRSLKVILALALSCSLLAFATAFPLVVLNFSDHEVVRSALESSSASVEMIFAENLVERLWFIDQDTCSNLCALLGASKQYKCCYHLGSRNQILVSGGEIRVVLGICRHVVSSVVALKNEVNEVQNEEIPSHIADNGFQLLSNTITNWLRIPFRIPKYFFRMRPYISPELFAFSADARNPGELTVPPGFHLSINLGLQLHNLPPHLRVKIKNLYCIVCSSPSFREPQSHGNDRDQVAMNKRLLHYVMQEQSKHCTCDHANHYFNDEIVYSFARFELHERGSGFSSCLLNVSNFSVGCYRIKWHTCVVDNEGCYWSLTPQNAGPIFTVRE